MANDFVQSNNVELLIPCEVNYRKIISSLATNVKTFPTLLPIHLNTRFHENSVVLSEKMSLEVYCCA